MRLRLDVDAADLAAAWCRDRVDTRRAALSVAGAWRRLYLEGGKCPASKRNPWFLECAVGSAEKGLVARVEGCATKKRGGGGRGASHQVARRAADSIRTAGVVCPALSYLGVRTPPAARCVLGGFRSWHGGLPHPGGRPRPCLRVCLNLLAASAHRTRQRAWWCATSNAPVAPDEYAVDESAPPGPSRRADNDPDAQPSDRPRAAPLRGDRPRAGPLARLRIAPPKGRPKTACGRRRRRAGRRGARTPVTSSGRRVEPVPRPGAPRRVNAGPRLTPSPAAWNGGLFAQLA